MAKQLDELRGPQCRYVTARALGDGYLACARGAGHEGPHVTVYELTWDWVTRDEYNATRLADKRAAARTFTTQHPVMDLKVGRAKRRRPSSTKPKTKTKKAKR